MGLFSFLQQFGGLGGSTSLNNPSIPISDAVDMDDELITTAGNRSYGHDVAMGIATLHSCVKVIAEDIASMDTKVMRRVEEDHWVTDYNHPVNKVLIDPNINYSWDTIQEAQTGNAALSGNGISRFIPDKYGYPLKIELHEYREVTVLMNQDLTEVYYQVTHKNGRVEVVHSREVLHIKNFSLNGYTGLSPVMAAKQSISIPLNATDYANETFSTGGYGGGVVTHPGDLSAAARSRISDGIRRQQAARKFPILDEGMKFHPNKMSPADIDYINTMKFSSQQIAGVYRVPLPLLQDTSTTNNSLGEQQALMYLQYCLQPWTRRWENEINRKWLVPQERPDIKLVKDMSTLNRPDVRTQLERIKTVGLLQIGTKDDLLKMMGMPPIGGEEGAKYVDFQKAANQQEIGQQKKIGDNET